MNAENFPLFLRQPERLWALNEHELRSLILEYPYSANLRLLLAQKAKMEDWPDAERLLALAATYHSDRKQLHWQMRMLPTQRPEDAPSTIEEVLELKPLNHPEPHLPELSELERTPPAAAEPPATRARIVPGAAAPEPAEEPDELVWPVALPDEAPAAGAEPVPDPWPALLEETIDTAAALPAAAIAVPTGEPPASPAAFAVSEQLVATLVSGVGALPDIEPYAEEAPTLAPPPETTEVVATVASGLAALPEWSDPPPPAPALAPREVIAPLPVETLPSYREQYRPARLATLSELLKEREAPKPTKRKKAKRRKPKTKEIARHPALLDHLQVCWLDAVHNCGSCGKCLRTRVTFAILGIDWNAN